MIDFITNWMVEIALGFLYAMFAIKIYNYVSKYYSTPQRTWVGLTEQEQGAIMEDLNAYGTNLYQFARAIEAKLKEKNT